MRAAVVAEKILALGRGFGQPHVDFAIEQAQRIALQPLMAVLAQLGEMGAAVFQHRLAKPRTAFGVAQRIDLEIQLKPELAAQLVDHHDQFGVGGGVGAAENLDSELRELAKAALLRALAPEHRTEVIEALLGIAAIHPGLDIGAHHAGRAFGPQAPAWSRLRRDRRTRTSAFPRRPRSRRWSAGRVRAARAPGCEFRRRCDARPPCARSPRPRRGCAPARPSCPGIL